MVTCPICNRDDAIQKVSAIRKGGTSTGMFVGPSGGVAVVGGKLGTIGGYTALAGRTTTRLAELFPPPIEPELNTRAAIGVGGAILLVVGLLIMVGMCSNASNVGGTHVAIFTVWLVVTFAVTLGERNSIMRVRMKEHEVERVGWQRQMAIYERLYYCHRDDITFDPATGQHRPVAQTWQLIQTG